MYGTVARLHVKEGMAPQALAILAENESVYVPGIVGVHVYQLDRDPHELILVVLFEDRDSYEANARTPAQHQRYLQMRAVLTEDPEWSDGAIPFSYTPA